jgi:hypothetical protein
VLPERELGFDTILDRRKPQLLEAADLDTGERLELEIGKGLPSPERLGLAQPGRPNFRISCLEGTSTLRRKPLEQLEVELAGLHPQQVARGASKQPPLAVSSRTEGLPQSPDLKPQRVIRAICARSGQQLVDQPVARDDPIGTEEKKREQRALPRPANPHRSVVNEDLERAKDPKIDPAIGHLVKTQFPPKARLLPASGRAETRLRQF